MLVVVLVFFFAFGCEVHAKDSLNMKFDRSDRLIVRNGRDFSSFLDQIEVASNLESSCDLTSCASTADSTVCNSFCKGDSNLMNQAMAASTKCLSTVPCGQRLNSWQLNDVEFPLAVDGYDGMCYLTGTQVAVTGENDVTLKDVQLFGFTQTNSPIYKPYSEFTVTYNGLSINCSSNSVNKRSTKGYGNNFLSQLVYRLLCSVSNFFNLGLIGLDLCFCDGGDGSDGGDGGPKRSEFSASVVVTQRYYIYFLNSFFGSVSEQQGCSSNTNAELGSGVPAEFQTKVQDAVQDQLNNFYLVIGVCNDYVTNINKALRATYGATCTNSICSR